MVILNEVGPLTEIITKKDQRKLAKRTLHLFDETGVVELTLWGEDAANCDFEGIYRTRRMINICSAFCVGYKGCKGCRI